MQYVIGKRKRNVWIKDFKDQDHCKSVHGSSTISILLKASWLAFRTLNKVAINSRIQQSSRSRSELHE